MGIEDVLKEYEKLIASWENQKNNNLKDARICDAYIKAFTASKQLLEQGMAKPKTKKTPSTE